MMSRKTIAFIMICVFLFSIIPYASGNGSGEADPSITTTANVPLDEITFGDEVTLTAAIHSSREGMLIQWQYAPSVTDLSEEAWVSIAGATGSSYTYIVDHENVAWLWRFLISEPGDAEANPPKELPAPPIPEIIRDKDHFSMLYVGNSFTFTGDVPRQVSALSKLYGVMVDYDTIMPPGASLSDTMDEAIEKMWENNYDYVVFQDYGAREPAETLADLRILCDEARKTGAIPVLYNPAFAQSNGKPDKEAQPFLTSTYERASMLNGAILVNAADAWVYAYDQHPNLSLYAENDYHANNAGAYLTACVFASTLFHLHIKDIAEENLYYGDDAIGLGQAAWEFVSNDSE